jgi:hypothetical protein
MSHTSMHTSTNTKRIGAKIPMMVSEPKLLGEIYGVRYEMMRATDNEMVRARCTINRIVPM